MEIKRSNGKYLAVKVPNESLTFEIKTTPKYLTGSVKRTCLLRMNTLPPDGLSTDCRDVPSVCYEYEIPYAEYKILGLLMTIWDNEPKISESFALFLARELDILDNEWNQWLIIKTN